MAQAKTAVPAVEGWFTMDPERPTLLGTRCESCGNRFFPKVEGFCRNPDCDGTELVEVALSRTGRIWSYTDNRYQPPPPYVAGDPFEPFALAAVELEGEKMVVLGQVVQGVAARDLNVGDEMELVLGPLYEDDDHTYMVWKWKPAGRSERG